jgi:glucosamine-6-phosphate deaminase
MEVIVTPNEEEMGWVATRMVADLVRRKPRCVLGLATGSTPLRMYKQLTQLHKQEGLDFSQVVTFNLDEYYPIAPDHPESYRYFMNDSLFDHINIPLAPRDGNRRWGNTYVPDGTAEDVEAHCLWYEQQIEDEGGIDIQILGVGSNGHIAFNEPGSSLGSRTRLKTLTKKTIEDNSRFFDNDMNKVPKHAITMGIGTILDAHIIILQANGAKKADAIAAAVEGPISSMCPASALQLHPEVYFVVDEPAASKLKNREYYDHVQESKKHLKR